MDRSGKIKGVREERSIDMANITTSGLKELFIGVLYSIFGSMFIAQILPWCGLAGIESTPPKEFSWGLLHPWTYGWKILGVILFIISAYYVYWYAQLCHKGMKHKFWYGVGAFSLLIFPLLLHIPLDVGNSYFASETAFKCETNAASLDIFYFPILVGLIIVPLTLISHLVVYIKIKRRQQKQSIKEV